MSTITIDISRAVVTDGSGAANSESFADAMKPAFQQYSITANGELDTLILLDDSYKNFFPEKNTISSISPDNQRAIENNAASITNANNKCAFDFEQCITQIAAYIQLLIKEGNTNVVLIGLNGIHSVDFDVTKNTITFNSSGLQFDVSIVSCILEEKLALVKFRDQISDSLDATFLLCAKACVSAYNDHDQLPLNLPDGWSFVNRFYVQEKQGPSRQGLLLKKGGNYLICIRGVRDAFEVLKSTDTSKKLFEFYDNSSTATASTIEGMNSMYLTMRTAIFGALVGLKDIKQLFVTGHSLGAAMAQMLVLDIMNYAKFRGFFGGMKFEMAIIAIAAPRWCDAVTRDLFVSLLNKYGVMSFVINNDNDIVPKLPAVAWIVPLVYNFGVSFGSSLDIVGNHVLVGYINALEKLS